jgi:2-polyprenyl-6-methoxyphenol hydroxylase-like FAD-dependent oxidoreductase
MTEFDALVVGTGPAGCVTALEFLSAGWRVGMLHRSGEVSAIESLSPQACRRLDSLSIQIGCSFSEVVAWWGFDQPIHAFHLGARIVERVVLAEALRARAIKNGAMLISIDGLFSIERFHHVWRLEYQLVDGGHFSLAAKYLIDATGRASVIGRRLGSRRIIFDDLFCISISLDQPDLVGTWTEMVSDGWWNLCSVREKGTLSFFSNARTIRKARHEIADRFCETAHLRYLLPAPKFGNCSIRPCTSSRLVPSAGSGWVAVGDAAWTLQPLASAGVAKALRDASMVRRAFNHPENYDRLQTAEFSSYVRQLAQQYALDKRWSENPFSAARQH